MHIDSDELARAAAQELSGEFGNHIADDLEATINGRGPNIGKPKALGIVEVVTVASAVLQAAQLAWELYQAGRNRIAIVEGLSEKLQTPPDFSAENRRTLIEAIVDKLFKAL